MHPNLGKDIAEYLSIFEKKNVKSENVLISSCKKTIKMYTSTSFILEIFLKMRFSKKPKIAFSAVTKENIKCFLLIDPV